VGRSSVYVCNSTFDLNSAGIGGGGIYLQVSTRVYVYLCVHAYEVVFVSMCLYVCVCMCIHRGEFLLFGFVYFCICTCLNACLYVLMLWKCGWYVFVFIQVFVVQVIRSRQSDQLYVYICLQTAFRLSHMHVKACT
jgi:hypothetical protein